MPDRQRIDRSFGGFSYPYPNAAEPTFESRKRHGLRTSEVEQEATPMDGVDETLYVAAVNWMVT